MRYRSPIAAAALLAALCVTTADTWAWDDALYPNFSGQWRPIGGPGRFDISKPAGRGQQAPLTPEYQAIFEANVKEQAAGGQGTTKTYRCFSPGMPRVTNGYGEIEFVVTPKTTHVLVNHIDDNRRIFTDGRPWPKEIEPTLLGYSIGKWVDTDGTANTTCSKPRRAACAARALSTRAACLCTGITRPWSRSASTSTRPIQRRPQRSHRDRQRTHASLDRDEELPAQPGAIPLLDGRELRREQQSRYHRR